jgi:hypothetical protein
MCRPDGSHTFFALQHYRFLIYIRSHDARLTAFAVCRPAEFMAAPPILETRAQHEPLYGIHKQTGSPPGPQNLQPAGKYQDAAFFAEPASQEHPVTLFIFGLILKGGGSTRRLLFWP